MTNAPSLRPRLTRIQVIILVAILVIAGVFRFYQISSPSLWMDEIWSIEMAMGNGSLHDHLPVNAIQTDHPRLTSLDHAAPAWSILTHLSGVTHPPLFFVLLRLWIDCFGVSAASVRTFSAVISLAILPIFFDLCRFLHGPKLALIATGMMALSLIQIELAQDARSYTMLMLFGVAAADAVVRIQFLGPNRNRLIAVVFFSVATALTHYLAVGFLFALAIYALVRITGGARLRTIVAFAIAGLISLAIWVPMFIGQKNTLPSLTPTFLMEAHGVNHFKLTIYRMIGLPMEFLLGEDSGDYPVRAPVNLVIAIFVFTLILPILRLPWRKDLLLWVLWSVGTIGFVACADLVHATTLTGYPRYTALASPAICAVISAFDWPRVRIVRDLVAIVFLVILTDAAAMRSASTIPAKEDWRELAGELNAHAEPGDLLVIHNPDPWVSSGTWYLGLQYYSPDFQYPWLIPTGKLSPDLARAIQSYPRIWLIGLRPELQARQHFPNRKAVGVISTSAGGACLLVARQ